MDKDYLQKRFNGTGEFVKRITTTKFFVELPDMNIESMIWKMHSKGSKQCMDQAKFEWESLPSGIGTDLGNGTYVHFGFSIIDGVMVCFYSPTSSVVDWNVIKEWFKKYIWDEDLTYKNNHCDAGNINDLFSYINKSKD